MSTNLTGSFVDVTYNQLLHISDGPTALEKTVYSGTGTPTALKLGTVSASIENIKFDGNTISTNDLNGDLFLSPSGVGAVVIANASILGGSIVGITDLTIADGGTGASDAAGARTNLGLDTMAIQNASAVAITGGTISGITFSGSITGAVLLDGTTVTGVTVNGGNLRLNGNTLSAVDTNGSITIAPDGSGVTNIGNLSFNANLIASTDANGNINITPNGTGVVVVPTIYATTLDTNVAAAGVTLAGTTLAADGTDADISITVTPKGTGSVVVSKADINGGTVDNTVIGGTVALAVTGTDVLATTSLGFIAGTGAGGTVTQITSKSTGVTLNKTVGQIVTHDESLAGNTGVSFTVTNSVVGANDVIVIHRASGGTAAQYTVRVDSVAAGSFVVQLVNDSGGALAEAVTLSFAVIKGAIT
jgi:hypothetical protein